MSRLRGAATPALTALVVRLLVVVWGRDLPPAGDGTYYHTLAQRLAEGKGYTWLWPDGAVTYAAHYPVGYPALVAVAYKLFGQSPVVAMTLNAVLGAVLAASVFVLARGHSAGSDASAARRRSRMATAAALAVALHPALVPYTLALMTEGAAIALLCAGAALVELSVAAREARRGRPRLLLLFAVVALGISTLVRPQCLLMAPVLGALSYGNATWRRRGVFAAVVTAGALLVCSPWTARNCVRMERCALVSVNGGWNLLIGTQSQNGSFATVEVPEECKTVWSEAGKDACFEAAAKRAILAHPGAWLSKVPRKLGTTFDYFGAAPWYIEVADAERVKAAAARGEPAARRFEYRQKVLLGTVETVASRALLLFACFALGVRGRRGLRLGLGLLATASCLLPWGTVGVLALAALTLAETERLRHATILRFSAAAIILETCMLHAAFFGGGRYGLVVTPFVCALGFACMAGLRGATGAVSTPNKRSPAEPARAEREESPSSRECDAG